jgi:hypothetical protein
MQLSSTAFSDRSAIPRRYTCDGEDLSPPLEWSDPPGTPEASSSSATIRMPRLARGIIGRPMTSRPI